MLNLLKAKKFQVGFTLIELLIAVSIIVILITIGAVSYSTVNRNARDSQRKSDMEKIKLALEEFHADNGAYPDEGYLAGGPSSTTYDRVTCGTKGYPSPTGGLRGTPGIAVGEAFSCNGRTYLSSMPADPSTGKGYYYETEDTFCNMPTDWTNCQQYTLWAHLENNNDIDVAKTSTDQICIIAKNGYAGLAFGNYDGNYCIHN